MIGRDEFLQKIDEAYAVRMASDKAAVASLMATHVSFRIAGEDLPIPGIPQSHVPAIAKFNDIIDAFQFHSVERLDAIFEGNKAAVHSRIVVSAKDGEKITAELYDLWTIGDDGKFTSLLQFLDASLVARLLAKA